MSTNPPLPEALRPLAPGYPRVLVELDAQMVALGRPTIGIGSILKPAAVKAHREAVTAWEAEHPADAARWHELYAQYAAEHERIESAKWSEDAWRFELMMRLGFPPGAVELCRAELRDTEMFTAARDFLLEGLRPSIVMTGGPGCGKTVAATWAAHQLLSRNFRPWWVSCPRESMSDFWSGAGEVRRFRAREAGVLVLDDLGEGARELKSEAWKGWLDEVLTERYAKRRRVIITTNRTVAELAAWLGARLVDRLNEGVICSTNAKSMRGQP